LTVLAVLLAASTPSFADEEVTAAPAEQQLEKPAEKQDEAEKESESGDSKPAETIDPPAAVPPAEQKGHASLTDAERSRLDHDTAKISEDAYYFIVVEGKGMPVREILLNGINVLGGSVISLSMPINVTRDIKLGLNEIKVRYVSHDKEGLVTLMEKRTSGPKRDEVIKLVLPPRDSEGKEMVKELAFNVDPAPAPPPKIEITPVDQQVILGLVESYYQALKTKNANKLKGLYATALHEEQKIFPEGADFFSKILQKEITLMKRKDIKMGTFSSDDVMLEQDGYKVRAVRKDRQPMMESNEVEVDVEPMFAEVDANAKKGQKVAKEQSKQRLVTTTLLFKKIDGQWHLSLPRGV